MIQRRHYNRILAAAIVVSAFAGAWVSGTLLAEHDGGWRAGDEGTAYLLRLCESEALPSASCANVVGSRWGSFDVYVGSRRIYVPTSLIGLVYFLSVAIWFVMVGAMPAVARWTWRFTLLAVFCGLAGSIFYTALMAFALSQWCPPCVLAHGLSAAIFVSTVLLWRSEQRAAEYGLVQTPGVTAYAGSRGLKPVAQRRLAIRAVVVAGAASVACWFYFDAMTEVRRQWRKLAALRQVITDMQNDRAFMLREYYAQPVTGIAGSSRPVTRVSLSSDRAEGRSPNAATGGLSPRLVIFTDYDSSRCACFESQLATLIETAFEGNLFVEYRYGPSRSADGALARQDLPRAALAAEAARLLGGPQEFANVRHLLFRHRHGRPARDYAKLARQAGLNVSEFLKGMDSEMCRTRVREDIALASQLGVTEAPAVFLEGRRVPDLCISSRVFWNAVADEMAKGRELNRPPSPDPEEET